MVDLIADVLLATGALGAAVYCIILARRLKRLNDLEGGVGGAVAVLAVQVDELTKMMSTAQTQVTESSGALGDMTVRAEDVARRLELLVASLHDIPEIAEPRSAEPLLNRSASAAPTPDEPPTEEPDEALETAIEQAPLEKAERKSEPQAARVEETGQEGSDERFTGVSSSGLGGIPEEEPEMVFRSQHRRGAA